MAVVNTILVLLLLAHALIHFLGFAAGFGLGGVATAINGVTRSIGALWLLTGLLLLLSIGLYWLRLSVWPLVGIVALGCSQYLIIRFWGDAKYGTFMNIMLLIWVLPGLGDFWFEQGTQKVRQVIQVSSQASHEVIKTSDIEHLPDIVQQWLTKSGVVGRRPITHVELAQTGKMRMNPQRPWMPFTANQYFNTSSHSFLWTTKVQIMPFIYLSGRDLLYEGQGSMKIKLLSLVDVVNARPNHKINTGAMIRYLAEMCWFPSAVVDERMEWEAAGLLAARATLTLEDVSVSGLFRFNAEGDMLSFEAMRYRGADEAAQQELWSVEMTSHTSIGGIHLPNKCNVSWIRNGSSFHWLELEVVNLIASSE